jgi:predicted short-subunit dehydrogenase-like oxidoreductase (DUF2520 family)
MRQTNPIPMTIIGAGKVGSTLAMLFHRAGYRIVSVISQNTQSARKLAHRTGCKKYSDSLSDIHPATRMILIAAPEEKVFKISEEIAKRPHLDCSALVAFHTSGSLTSDALLPLRKAGAMTFSLHPIQSFSKASTLASQMARMKNIFYGFEGSTSSLPVARQLVKDLNGSLVRIPKEEKILYHIACVVASNYSTALIGAVDELTKRMGGGITLSHFEPLVKMSIENAFHLTPGKALTGPIVRGSVKTVESHVRELQKTDTSLVGMYRQLGLQALKMAVLGKSLSPKVAKQMKRILKSENNIVRENH